MRTYSGRSGKSWIDRQIEASLEIMIARLEGDDEWLLLPDVARLLETTRGCANGFLRRFKIERTRRPAGYVYSRDAIVGVLDARRSYLVDRRA